MAKCPKCDKEIELVSEIPYRHADRYGVPSVVRTKCCGDLVVLRPVRRYAYDEYNGPNKTDDWGD